MKDGKGTPFVVEVVPIVRGITKSTLSYFTTQELSVGDFVKVPVRNGEVSSIVAAVHDASLAKTDLKRSSFALKKLKPSDKAKKDKQSSPRISESFVRAAERVSIHYATTLGNVLNTLLPKMFLEEPELIFAGDIDERRPDPQGPKNEPLLVQMDSDERFGQYRSIIRESLAKKTSVMFIAPTEEEAQRAYSFLSHGIKDYAHLFMLSRRTKEIKEVLQKAKNSKHPVLFVTTPAGVAFDRSDLETIILDRENSRSYRTYARPFIHLKVFLECLARESKKRLILGDSILSLESLWRERNGEYLELLPLKWKLTSSAYTSLVDMKSESRPQGTGKEGFRILSAELLDMISRALEEGEKVFLFGARKGLSPTTLCGDCGSILSCKNCSAPVVLHSSSHRHKTESESPNISAENIGARVYICHACRARRPAETRCDICGSWKLSSLGIGIEKIAHEILAAFPGVRISVLDKDHTPTPTQAKKAAKNFQDQGQILIGTELAFLYLDKISYAGLVSADALFSIPDFSINERIFYLVSRIREMSTKETIIQTRNIGKTILGWASSGNILEFYRSEISEREELSYPPISLFIKVTLPLKSRDLQSKKEELARSFADWRPEFVSDKASTSMIIRIMRDKWPDKELASKLSLLSPDFLIKVDPESIL